MFKVNAALFCLATVAQCNAAEPVRVVPEKEFPFVRQPQVAVSPTGQVFIVFGVEDTIYCSTSSDGGKSYQPPVKVGEAGVMSLGMRRGPRVAATDKAVVVTAICGKVGRGKDGNVLAWRSADNGKTWQGPRPVNTAAESAREGLHHLAAGPDGSVCCVWLDLRNRKSQVFGSVSTNGGAHWQNEKLIYASPEGSVCECCQPSVAYDPRGGLHVLWRNQLGGARDMWLTSSKDGGRSFGQAVKLGEGSWTLRQCPMDGGALAAKTTGEITTIWMRQQEVFHSTPGKQEVALGRGEQAWAAAGSEGLYLVWLKARPGNLLMLAPGSSKPMLLAERAFDPVVAASINGQGPVIAAWEEGHGNQMQIKAMVLGGR